MKFFNFSQRKMIFLINKSNIPFFFLLMIFSFFNKTKQNKIVFPFKTESLNSLSNNYIDNLIQSRKYITIEIGNPKKILNLYLTMDTSYLIISNSSLDSSYYNNEKSQTYLNTSDLLDLYSNYLYNGYYAQETFWFLTSLENNEKSKFNNIEFILAMKFSDKTKISPGYFGLQIPKKNKPNIYNCLKKENVISEEYWNIEYTSDNEGYFILGEYPPEYINENLVRKANAYTCGPESTDLCWTLKFNNIKFGEIDVNMYRAARIYPEFEFIIAPGEYEYKISENFFNKLNDKCKKKLTESRESSGAYYYYYECETDIDISNFQNLEFSHSEFMFHFILTKDDLFKMFNDKIYFLIIFYENARWANSWTLGKPFLKKYNFGFNTYNHKIYFFHKEDNEEQQGSNYIAYYFIIGILVIGVIVMTTFVIFKKYLKPKRKKANELTEEINETSDENKKNQHNLGV